MKPVVYSLINRPTRWTNLIDMPEELRKALPNEEQLKGLLGR